MAETTQAAPTTIPAQSTAPSAAVAATASVASPSPTPTASTPPASPPAGDSFVVGNEPVPAVAAPAKATAARPDGIPDDLWDADAGTYKPDSIKQLLERDSSERTRRAGLPKSATEYKPDLPDSVKLPEGATIDVNNSRFKALQEIAHAEGWTQKAFSTAIGLEVQRVQTEAATIATAIKARDEALGPNGPARVDAITNFAKTIAPNDKVAGEIAKMLVTPGIIETFERIQTALGSQGITALSRAPVAPAADPKKVEGWDKMSPREQIAYSLERGRQQASR